MIMAAILFLSALCLAGALVGFRWQLTAMRAERDAQRAHELALHKEVVRVDQAALDSTIAKVGTLEARVKTLEYRPIKT